MDEKVNLIEAFTSLRCCQNVFKNLMSYSDPTVAVLALEGLYRMESDVESGQFPYLLNDVRNFLRKWRRESPLGEYKGAYGRVPEILKSLTIFKTLEVPLFIDNYGTKELLSSYGGFEDIHIDGSTPIYHVTHLKEAQKIVEQKQLKPSDNKNIIEGCWFGLDNTSQLSVYGSISFETTLSKLGVNCLHQGEIVSYKKEVNVILYAGDDTLLSPSEGLKKPTDYAVQGMMRDPGAYVKISIFVPSRFLPSPWEFSEVVSGPFEVKHGPFCIREKRSSVRSRYICKELSTRPVDELLGQLSLNN